MKSLLRSLLLLPLIAVIAVNGLYFPENGKDHLELELRNSVNSTTAEPSADCESNGGECKKNKKQCKATINKEYTCSKKGVCCIAEVNAQDTVELMIKMLNNTILSLKQTVEIKISNLSDAISNFTRQDCPEGFFQLSPSGQCLKLFYDQKRTWFEANTTCQSEGLVMARPSDPETLRTYLVNTYGYDPSKSWPAVWIPARGSGSYYFIYLHPNGAWNTSGDRIYYYNPYWYSARSSSNTWSSTYCIYMVNYESYMLNYPGKPYWYSTCSSRSYYALCELVKE